MKRTIRMTDAAAEAAGDAGGFQLGPELGNNAGKRRKAMRRSSLLSEDVSTTPGKSIEPAPAEGDGTGKCSRQSGSTDNEISVQQQRVQDEGQPQTSQTKAPSAPFIVDMSAVPSVSNTLTQNPTASAAFPYKSLARSEIRVITLQPGTDMDPIECRIEHQTTNLKDQHYKPYKALSYAWGRADATDTILLNDVSIAVRENLSQALYHLRYPDVELRLWVDAICINQSDISERNLQVTRMGTIYSLAEEVLVWLGPEDLDSSYAMNFLREMFVGNDLVTNNNWRDPLKAGYVEAIESLTRRDYWQRIWIIQEIFRARTITIQCGFDELPWPQLAKFIRRIRLHHEAGVEIGKQLHTISRSFAASLTEHRSSQGQDLESLLVKYQDSLSTDPRDKVYALIGLAQRKLTSESRTVSKEAKDKWLAVDYSRSTVQLFQDLTRLFSYEPVFGQRDCVLVRRMQMLQRTLRMQVQLPSVIRGIVTSYDGNEHPSHELDTAGTTLTCMGLSTTRVTSVGPCWSRGSSDLETISAWAPGAVDPKKVPQLLQAAIDLTADDLQRVQGFAFVALMSPKSASPEAAPSSGQGDGEVASTSAMQPALLVVTADGEVGFAPSSVRPCDRVVKFATCDVALLVRKTRQQESTKHGRKSGRADYEVLGRILILKAPATATAKVESSSDRHLRYAVPRLADVQTRSREANVLFSLSLHAWQFLTW